MGGWTLQVGSVRTFFKYFFLSGGKNDSSKKHKNIKKKKKKKSDIRYFLEKKLEKYSQLLFKKFQPNFYRIWPKTADFIWF